MCTYKLFLALKVFPQNLQEYVNMFGKWTLSTWFTILIFCEFDFPHMEQMKRDFPSMISFLTYSYSMLLSGPHPIIERWHMKYKLLVIELKTIKWLQYLSKNNKIRNTTHLSPKRPLHSQLVLMFLKHEDGRNPHCVEKYEKAGILILQLIKPLPDSESTYRPNP